MEPWIVVAEMVVSFLAGWVIAEAGEWFEEIVRDDDEDPPLGI